MRVKLISRAYTEVETHSSYAALTGLSGGGDLFPGLTAWG